MTSRQAIALLVSGNLCYASIVILVCWCVGVLVCVDTSSSDLHCVVVRAETSIPDIRTFVRLASQNEELLNIRTEFLLHMGN